MVKPEAPLIYGISKYLPEDFTFLWFRSSLRFVFPFTGLTKL